MEPETYTGDYYAIDTREGTEYLPLHVDDIEYPSDALVYTEVFREEDVYRIEIWYGTLRRLTRPGYLDCTPWEPRGKAALVRRVWAQEGEG